MTAALAPCAKWPSASGVEMPICLEVHRVMHEGRPVRAALHALMGREVRSETD